MTDTTGRRTNIPSDPTAERTSDPMPTGEDVIDREKPGRSSRPEPGRHHAATISPSKTIPCSRRMMRR